MYESIFDAVYQTTNEYVDKNNLNQKKIDTYNPSTNIDSLYKIIMRYTNDVLQAFNISKTKVHKKKYKVDKGIIDLINGFIKNDGLIDTRKTHIKQKVNEIIKGKNIDHETIIILNALKSIVRCNIDVFTQEAKKWVDELIQKTKKAYGVQMPQKEKEYEDKIKELHILEDKLQNMLSFLCCNNKGLGIKDIEVIIIEIQKNINSSEQSNIEILTDGEKDIIKLFSILHFWEAEIRCKKAENKAKEILQLLK